MAVYCSSCGSCRLYRLPVILIGSLLLFILESEKILLVIAWILNSHKKVGHTHSTTAGFSQSPQIGASFVRKMTIELPGSFLPSHQKWFCPVCHREFTCSRCFQLHLSQNKNTQCKAFYDSNPSTAPVGVCVVPQERNQEEPDVLPCVNPVNMSVDALDVTVDSPNDDLSSIDGCGGDVDGCGGDASLNESHFACPESPIKGNDDVSTHTTMDQPLPDPPIQGNEGGSPSAGTTIDPPFMPAPNLPTDGKGLDQFWDHTVRAQADFGCLIPDQEAAIELMSVLDKAGAPL